MTMEMQNNDMAPATKGDLSALGQVLRSEMVELREGLRSEMAGVREELKSDIAGVRQELKSEIAEFRRELYMEIIKTNGRIDRMEQNLKEQMSAESSKILKTISDFYTKCEKVDHDQVIVRYRVDELEKRVKNLENPMN